jgi:hypothetical protein
LLLGLAEVDDTIVVDARTPEEDARAPAPACNSCARSGHRGSSRRRFPASPSTNDLGKPLPRETLARAVPCACMQRTAGTMAIRRRPSSNRMAGKPRTVSVGAGLAGASAGPIRPRSGEAWPDPACLLFFCLSVFCYSNYCYIQKLVRKFSRPQKIVIQIFL